MLPMTLSSSALELIAAGVLGATMSLLHYLAPRLIEVGAHPLRFRHSVEDRPHTSGEASELLVMISIFPEVVG